MSDDIGENAMNSKVENKLDNRPEDRLKEIRDLARMPGVLLAPSILSADPLAIGVSLDSLRGEADWIHVDIMDGHFVPNLTYGPALVRALRRGRPDAFIDTHIMVERADDFLDMFLGAGVSSLSVHAEATPHLHRVIQRIRDAGVHPGVALNPATSLGAIELILPMVDIVLVMSVDPGFSGQKFIPETLAKVKNLVRVRAVYGLDFLIEVDGGVSAANARALREAGCDALVAGNAVFSAPDPAEMCREIKRQAALADEAMR